MTRGTFFVQRISSIFRYSHRSPSGRPPSWSIRPRRTASSPYSTLPTSAAISSFASISAWNFSVEILLCLLGCVYSSADKQTAQKHRQSRVGLEFHCKCIVRISDKPFFHKKLYPLDKFFQFFRCKTIFVIAEMTAHFRDRLFLCKLCKLVLAECYQNLLGTLS